MNVLIVDDSAVFRMALRHALSGIEGIKIVGTANHGKAALYKLKQESVDLITLDLEMPEMDGLQTITEIRRTNKNVSIIVFSAHSEAGAQKTLEALSAGADDFVAKPASGRNVEESVELIRRDLVPRVLQFTGRARGVTGSSPAVGDAKAAVTSPVANVVGPSTSFRTARDLIKVRPRMVLIGCSTGGPEALKQVFKRIKNLSGVPILVVQHMPPVFTAQLARMLDNLCDMTVKEAVHGEPILDHHAYIAPGDYHMTVAERNAQLIIQLNQDEKVQSVRPAVDVLFESVADVVGRRVVAFVLTGMGEDGLRGAEALKKHGVPIVIQDQASSVVWGMPGSIHAKGLHDKVLTLTDIGPYISDTVE